MKRMYKIGISILAVATILMFILSWAAGTPRTLDLESTDKHPGASGTAVIDEGHLSIQARGFKPDAIYTVWSVNVCP